MPIPRRPVRLGVVAVFTVVSCSVLVRAQSRGDVTINDTGVQAESLTSSQDGSVYFGSTA